MIDRVRRVTTLDKEGVGTFVVYSTLFTRKLKEIFFHGDNGCEIDMSGLDEEQYVQLFATESAIELVQLYREMTGKPVTVYPQW